MEQKRDVKPRWGPRVLDSLYLKNPCKKILHKGVTNIAEPSAHKWLFLSGAVAVQGQNLGQ